MINNRFSGTLDVPSSSNVVYHLLGLVKLLFYRLKKNKNMEKLVFDYTYCSEPECWEWDIPFEYESKEKFIFDVLENPMILNKIGIPVYEHQLEPKIESHLDYITNVDEYVFTLEEWFNKNKTII